jgi:hypothetical protein
MKNLKRIIALIVLTIGLYQVSCAQSDEDICTLTTAIWLPVRLGTSSASCAAIVTAPNPLSAVGCWNVVNILTDPADWWSGNVNNCQVALKEYREGNYVKAVITITGKRKYAEPILNAFSETK